MTTTVATNGIDVDSTLKKVDELKDKSLRLPKPAGYKMLVALPQIEEKTAGGITKDICRAPELCRYLWV